LGALGKAAASAAGRGTVGCACWDHAGLASVKSARKTTIGKDSCIRRGGLFRPQPGLNRFRIAPVPHLRCPEIFPSLRIIGARDLAVN
jgi:hypothetical protein